MILIKIKLHQFLRILKYDGGEGGLNPRTSCPVAGFQDQCFQPLSQFLILLILERYINCISFKS